VRYPLIPGINDSQDDVAALGTFVAANGIRRIDVLPYHRAGIAKYHRLGRTYPLVQLEPPHADRVRQVVDRLRDFDLEVTAGGLT
jgi:pyruvate formate lyase activating enzyme